MAASQRRPTRAEIEASQERARATEKVKALRPTLEDYVSEGVIDHVPEGKYSIPVDGKRVLQMNEEANRLAAWHGDNLAASPAKAAVREAQAEKIARKRHRPRASIIVPEMPWKRRGRRKREGSDS